MAIETCPHCFTSVIFSDSSLCPCCGKDKESTSIVSREEFEAQLKREENQIICSSLLKRARACLIIGGTLFTIFLITTILSFFTKYGGTLFLTGVFASLAILIRGFRDILERNKLKRAIKS